MSRHVAWLNVVALLLPIVLINCGGGGVTDPNRGIDPKKKSKNPPPKSTTSLTITTTALSAGQLQISYQQTLQAAGGITPYTWSITTGSLPPGLTLASSTGQISGKPTQAGTFSFTVQVADSSRLTASKAFSLSIASSQLTITTTSLPNGTIGQAYSATLAATGGATPYTWSVALGTLPSGLSLSTAGLIAGTPTQAGTFSATFQVKDSTYAQPQTATKSLSILIASAQLQIVTTSLADATIGLPYSIQLGATGGVTPYSWSIKSGALPAGLALSASGVISGTPTTAGTYSFTAQVADSTQQTATQNYTLAVKAPTASSCTTSGSTITISGNQTTPYDSRSNPLASGTKVDATTAQWIGVSAYPINWAGGPGMCWTGGYVQNDPTIYTDSTSWSTWSTSAAFISYGVNQTIENLRLDHVGDAINIQLQNGAQTYFTVRGVYVSDAHDDCLENTREQGGLTDDSLFDGCYESFSARPPSADLGTYSGANNVWTIQNSLVRLQDQIGVASGPSPGNAGFFKWDFSSYNSSPKLKLYNNVFRLDLASFIGQEYAPPPDKLIDCSNNIMVWLGGGPYPVTLPSCFTVTSDVTVWDNAVAAWKAKHGY